MKMVTLFLLKILFKILIMDQVWHLQYIAFNLSDTLLNKYSSKSSSVTRLHFCWIEPYKFISSQAITNKKGPFSLCVLQLTSV